MGIRHDIAISSDLNGFCVLAQDDNPSTVVGHRVSKVYTTKEEAESVARKLDRELAAGLVPGYEIDPPWIIDGRYGPCWLRDSEGRLHLVGAQKH